MAMIRNEDFAMTKHSVDDIASLLPFYVAGTLEETEAREVARWLETDPRGPAALERALDEQAEVIAANERVKVPSGSLARLMQDVDREPRKAAFRVTRLGLLSRIAEWLAETPPAVSWAAAGALALVVIVQNAPIIFQGGEKPYEVSSGAPADSGTLYLIRFADGADMAAVSAALSEAGAVIVDGPKGKGNFIVRLAEGDAYGPAKDRVETLRARRDIVTLIIERQARR
jgi:anti-sigma-K factor RskA